MTSAWNKGLTKEDPRVAKYIPPKTGKVVKCLNCNKEHYRRRYKLKVKRQFCSNKCFIDWKKENGWITGYWKNKKMSKKHRDNLSKSHLGHKVTNEVKEKLREKNILSNHPQWLGGKSFEPYGVEFNDKLREQIRKRDNHICQECNYSQKELNYKLYVHHIDYNKRNNNEKNLISLCRNCHLQTNFKRENWTKYLQNKLNNNYALHS